MSQSITYTVYCITCSASSMGYIGVSKRYQYRIREHLNSLRNAKHINKRLQQAFNEHGETSLSFRILESGIPIDRVKAREQFWIEHLNTRNNGYNLDKGGGGIRKGVSKQTELSPEPPDLDDFAPQKRTKSELFDERHIIEVALNLWSPYKPEEPHQYQKFCATGHWEYRWKFGVNTRNRDGLCCYCYACTAKKARERYHAKKLKKFQQLSKSHE